MYKRRLLVILMFVAVLATAAGKPLPKDPPIVVTPAVMRLDSSKIKPREFNQATLEDYRNQPEFKNYARDKKPDLSLWDRFWAWFWNWINSLFGAAGGKADNSYMNYFIIAIAVVAVIVLVVKLIGADLSGLFKRESKQVMLPYSESLENIHEITFDDELEKALAQRNYKLAVRLLYLASLKQLNDAGLINWQIEKTNAAYLAELNDSGQRQNFAVLTRQFEYVWYGNFPVNSSSFQNIRALFLDFKKLLP